MNKDKFIETTMQAFDLLCADFGILLCADFGIDQPLAGSKILEAARAASYKYKRLSVELKGLKKLLCEVEESRNGWRKRARELEDKVDALSVGGMHSASLALPNDAIKAAFAPAARARFEQLNKNQAVLKDDGGNKCDFANADFESIIDSIDPTYEEVVAGRNDAVKHMEDERQLRRTIMSELSLMLGIGDNSNLPLIYDKIKELGAARVKIEKIVWMVERVKIWDDFLELEKFILDKPIDHEKTSVYTEIFDERVRQDSKWGGPDHDDQHSVSDFVTFIIQHAKRAESENSRRQLVRVAALAVAAIESMDRKSLRVDEHGAVWIDENVQVSGDETVVFGKSVPTKLLRRAIELACKGGHG